MPYDASVPGAESDGAGKDRRGPMRPSRLQTARSRLSGATLTHLVRLSDWVILGVMAVHAWTTGAGGIAVSLPLLGTVLIAATLIAFETYRLTAKERMHLHLYRVIGAVGGACMAMMAFAGLFGPEGRTAQILSVADWGVPTGVLLCVSHLAWFGYISNLRRRGLLTPNLFIVGATPAAGRFVAAAIASGDVNILGVFDDRGERSPKNLFGVPILGRSADLKDHRLLPYVDQVVIAVPAQASARIAQLIDDLAPVPNNISLLVADYDPQSERAAHERLLDMPLAHLVGARRGALQSSLKRMMDVSFSIGGLIVLAPALVAISIAIRLDSPGPVLFKQRRHGYMNEEVLVWKFRSMRVEATDHTAARQVSANDDRVTRVGRFIRRTSLDELPQLWNVIRGEMSLVGPRPHAIGMLTAGAEATKLVETYAHRHRTKPGLTGWAAVNGSRGPVDTPEAVRRRVSLDLEYVDRQSVWLDLMIILRTLPCVLGDSTAVR